jgi:hypothetical protein
MAAHGSIDSMNKIFFNSKALELWLIEGVRLMEGGRGHKDKNKSAM